MAKVFVIVGPAGVGKGTLVRMLMDRMPQLRLSVSATTRTPRPGEVDGESYHFLTRAEFDRRIADGDFVEHAEYSGHQYGTPASELRRRTDAGEPVLLEIEVQGARQVLETLPSAVTVFIAPPSEAALRTRLIGRGTDSPEQIELRLQTAASELAASSEFQYRVVNDRLDDAVAELVAIVERELD